MRVAGTAFASDFDGTLCQSDWETWEEHYDPAVLDAVRRYQRAGGLFGVCTGRTLGAVTKSLEGILTLDFYIVATGAQVFDKDLRPIFQRTIDRDVASQLCEMYVSDKVDAVAVVDGDLVSVGKQLAPDVPVVGSLGELAGNLYGVSFECHGDVDLARQVRDDMNKRFGTAVEGFQNLGSVDVVAKGCSKGAGVEIAKDALGVSCIAGAGDSYNDLPLLQTADVSYTFHDSPQSVREAATHVVSNLADALAHFTR